MDSREEKEVLTCNLKKTLAAIKRLSIEDLAEIQIMDNFGLNNLRKRKHPFFELLHKCFLQLSKNVQGAEMVMTLLSDALPKEITLLADHELTSKLNVLLGMTGETLNYELTSLAIAMAEARIESKLIIDLKRHDELKQKTEKELKEKINEMTSKYKTLSDAPFFFARERLEWFLGNVENINDMMLDFFEEEDIEYIKILFHILDEIAKGPESENQKLNNMEQTVVDIYWQLRKNQGFFDNEFANALETFLNSPRGLNIPLKYGIDIPHRLTKEKIDIAADAAIGIAKPEDMLFLLTTKQEQGSYAEKYKKLIILLSPENLKTDRRAAINKLISQVEEIKDEADIESLERIMAEAYVAMSNQYKNTFFGCNCNFVAALEKFCKKELNMDEQELKNLGVPQVRKIRIMGVHYYSIAPAIFNPRAHISTLCTRR